MATYRHSGAGQWRGLYVLPGEPDAQTPAGCNPPRDLRDWVEIGTLLSWVAAEAGQFAAAPPGGGTEARTAFQAKLRVLAYAYAIHFLESEEVAKACRTEEVFQQLCNGTLPQGTELSHFRRNHRQLLAAVLARLFHRAASLNQCCAEAGQDPDALGEFQRRALHRLDLARHMDSCDE